MEEKKSIWELRKKPYRESYLTKFVRLWTYPITAVLARTPVTPNMVSLFTLFLRLVTPVFFILGGYGNLVIGGLLAWLSVVLDHVDGELARIRNQVSNYGFWLDTMSDRLGDVAILIGMAIHAYLRDPTLLTVTVGLAAVVSTTLWRLLSLYNMAIFHKDKQDMKGNQKRFGFDEPLMYLIITVGALTNQVFYALLFFAVVINLAVVKNLVVGLVKNRKLN